MKWLKIWRVGSKVISALDAEGVKVKGMPIGDLAALAEVLVRTTKTAAEAAKPKGPRPAA